MADGRSSNPPGRRTRRGALAALAVGTVAAGLVTAIGVAVLEWDALREDAATFGDEAVGWRDPNTQFDRALGWRPIPDRRIDLAWGRIETNAQGFRSAPLRSGAEAVVVLGDSVAWGLGVDGSDVFAARLDRRYAARGWQVSNLAVSGYGLGQSHLWLERQHPALPRLRHAVLAVCADNDFDDTISNTRYGRRKPLFRDDGSGLRLEGVPIARHGLRHWYTDSRFVRGLLGRAPRLEAWLLERAGDVRLGPEEADRVVRGVLAALRDAVAARGGTLHALLIPSTRDWKAASTGYESMRQAIRASDLPLIEPRDFMHAVSPAPEALYLDATHLSPRGHQLVAFSVERYLVRFEERTRARSQTATTPSS